MKNTITIWIGFMIALGLCFNTTVLGSDVLIISKSEFVKHDEGVEPLEKDYTGYKIELIKSETELKKSDPLFKQFGNIRLETIKSQALPYAYLIGDFSKWKSANDFLVRVIESRFSEAKVVQFSEGARVKPAGEDQERPKGITGKSTDGDEKKKENNEGRLSMVVDKIEKPKQAEVITIAPKATAKRTNRTTRISFNTTKPAGTAKSPEPKEEIVATVAKKEKVKSKTKKPKKLKIKPTKKPAKTKVRPKEVLKETVVKPVEPKEKPAIKPAVVKTKPTNSEDLKRLATINTLAEKYDGYKVLLLETDQELEEDDPLFKEFGNLTLEYLPENEKPYQYLIGDFDNWEGTENFMELVITPRFPNAKVIKYRKGKRKKKNAFDY